MQKGPGCVRGSPCGMLSAKYHGAGWGMSGQTLLLLPRRGYSVNAGSLTPSQNHCSHFWELRSDPKDLDVLGEGPLEDLLSSPL